MFTLFGPNFNIDLSDFPYHAGIQNFGCIMDTLNPAGEMFVNYMDYSDDEDVTMFTKDQVKKGTFSLTLGNVVVFVSNLDKLN